MIPEPQRAYVLELLAALGPAAGEFVIAGAQAIKFGVKDARGTKDVGSVGCSRDRRWIVLAAYRFGAFNRSLPRKGRCHQVRQRASESTLSLVALSGID